METTLWWSNSIKIQKQQEWNTYVYQEKYQAVRKDLQRLEQQLGDGPYFNGAQFAIVDAVYAPPLMRFNLIERYYDFKLINDCPKIRNWQQTLLSRESVKQSVVPEFEKLFTDGIRDAGGYAAQWFPSQWK